MEIVIANQEEIRFDGNKNQVVLVFIVARVIANTNVLTRPKLTKFEEAVYRISTPPIIWR